MSLTGLFTSQITVEQAEAALAKAQEKLAAAEQKCPELKAAVSAAGIEAARTGDDAPILLAIDAERVNEAKIEGLTVLVAEAETTLADARDVKAAYERDANRKAQRAIIKGDKQLASKGDAFLADMVAGLTQYATGFAGLVELDRRLSAKHPAVEFLPSAMLNTMVWNIINQTDPSAQGIGVNAYGKPPANYSAAPLPKQYRALVDQYVAKLERSFGLDQATNEQDEAA